MIVKTNLWESESDSNKIYIHWDPKFELGIPVIDAQHKKLVELCNTLYQELMQTQTTTTPDYKTALAEALHECVDYVKTHFKDEETLLRAAGYSGYEQQKMQHEEFVKKILETSGTFDKITFTGGIEFVKFLYSWILTHIAHEDKLYVKPVLEYYRTLRTQK